LFDRERLKERTLTLAELRENARAEWLEYRSRPDQPKSKGKDRGLAAGEDEGKDKKKDREHSRDELNDDSSL
jgi:hypothetical protein